MLTLYHAPHTRSTRMIWLLEELQVKYCIEYVDIYRYNLQSGSADERNPHPDKKVPAIEDDGLVLTESGAIALYLTDKYPAAGLGASVKTANRADYVNWLFYFQGTVEPVMMFRLAEISHPALHAAFRSLEEAHNRISSTLAIQPYLAGDTFSSVDLLLSSISLWGRNLLPPGTVIDDYLARCVSRPACARASSMETAPD